MADYAFLNQQITSLAEMSTHYLPLLSNASALLYEALEEINWAGFYLVRDGRLLLGPFQGKPACVVIEKGKGVCGTAWAENATQLVSDVHAFPGHIACDAASRSEIVIPIHCDKNVVGVLDIDSPILSRFSKEDQTGLEAFVQTIEHLIDWENCRDRRRS